MSRRLPSVLTAAELQSLLREAQEAVNTAKAPSKQFGAWRDFCMIQIGWLAGPRVAEMCALRVANVDLVGGSISIVAGKGDKDRNVPISAKLQPVLQEWIGARTDGWLFPGPRGKQLSERTFQLRLESLCKKAGIHRAKAHPHILRHTFATMLHKKKVSLRNIQQLLGHSSVAITEIYTHVNVDDLKGSVDLL